MHTLLNKYTNMWHIILKSWNDGHLDGSWVRWHRFLHMNESNIVTLLFKYIIFYSLFDKMVIRQACYLKHVLPGSALIYWTQQFSLVGHITHWSNSEICFHSVHVPVLRVVLLHYRSVFFHTSIPYREREREREREKSKYRYIERGGELYRTVINLLNNINNFNECICKAMQQLIILMFKCQVWRTF